MTAPHRIVLAVLSIAVLACALLLVAACGSPDGAADARFAAVAREHLDRMLELHPEWATQLGDHRFDDRVSDFTADGYKARADFARVTLSRLDSIDPRELSAANRIDWLTLRNACESSLFEITELKEHRWNPTVYNPGDGLYSLLARDFAPLPDRLRALKARLEALPATLEAARENLDNPPRVMTETAIRQNPGVINLVMDGLQEHLALVPELREEFRPVRTRAIAALDAYGRWLETDLLPRSKGDFRLGRRLWEQKLRHTLASDLDPAVILADAERDLAATRAEMVEVALPLYRDYFGGHVDDDTPGQDALIRRVLARLADDHPTDRTIVPEAREGLDRITEFVRRKKLVTVPDETVEIIVMPEHQRGFAIGYCDSPGPLEVDGTTFYAISPTPRDWSAARKETFYREYNDFMLQDLTIHEAMPGHALQIAHANEYEAATPLRAVYSSGTFVEGWATYAEQLMVEAGYGGPELHLQQLKMRLRLIINAILDQRIHCDGMTEGEAMEMMMVDGFQEEGEAAGKWIRACLSSTQLSTYYVGNLEINGIRDAYARKHGEDFDRRTFHDELLSFGSPAPMYARELMGLE